MFLKFTLRALRYRRQRLLLSFSALAVAATLATVLFGIYGTIERRIREEFGGYGANIAVVPARGNTIPLAIAGSAEAMGAEVSPFLITSARVSGRVLPVAGYLPEKAGRLNRYWHIEGRLARTPGECMAGAGLGIGRGRLAVGNLGCEVVGIVSTGSSEDSELLVPFSVAENISGLTGLASVIQVRSPGERVEQVRNALAKQFPQADVRTIRSVAGTESAVVLKVRGALFLLTLLILGITTLCVSSNFSEMVMERAKEIGILKALGAAERRIATFFVSESAALAMSASISGYLAGIVAAAAIGRAIFGTAFHIQGDLVVFLAVTLVMLGVAAVATALAAAGIWRIQPAAILRGD